jgi:hypothetical protein
MAAQQLLQPLFRWAEVAAPVSVSVEKLEFTLVTRGKLGRGGLGLTENRLASRDGMTLLNGPVTDQRSEQSHDEAEHETREENLPILTSVNMIIQPEVHRGGLQIDCWAMVIVSSRPTFAATIPRQDLPVRRLCDDAPRPAHCRDFSY